MSYQEGNVKQERRKRKIRHWFFFFIALLLIALCVFSAFVPPSTWKYRIVLPTLSPREEGELRIHVLDSKHGDCTLLELPNGETVLLGGGADEEASRENVLRFLYALKPKRIDYLVATGIHRDQNGALERVIDFFEVGKVYLSIQTGGQSGAYSNFVAAANRKGIACVSPSRGELLYQSADALCSVRFLGAEGEENAAKETALYVTYGATNAILGGEMNAKLLQQLMQEDAVGVFSPWGISFEETEIVKIGSKVDEETAQFFLRWSGGRDAVISCREEPSYAPDETLVTAICGNAKRLFRTDEDGHITFIITNEGYQVKTEK